MDNKKNLPFTSPKLDPYIKKLTEFGIENGQDKVKGYPKKKENKQPSLPGVNWEYSSWGDEQTERLTEKNSRTINELKDLKKFQDGTFKEPTVGTTLHRKKYPERYGGGYISKLEQAVYPKPGTAPSEKRDHYKHLVETGKILEPTKEEIKRAKEPSTWDLIYKDMSPIKKAQHNYLQRKKGYVGKTGEKINAYEPVKYDDRGYPDKATPKQVGAMAERLEEHRQMTGSDGRYDKPKKKINAYADVKIEIPTIDHLLLRNSNHEARDAALEKTRLYAFATRPDPDAVKGIGSFKNTIGKELRAANSKSDWIAGVNYKYKDNKNE